MAFFYPTIFLEENLDDISNKKASSDTEEKTENRKFINFC